ncbi:MAG: tyrosine-type recombinase/integrase, partial [Fibromonadaceae bacterium]|nr:tyrosine-type recombinase/integrase [Fibromonadaceae bacterium]
MASANKITIDGLEYIRVTDTSLGRRLQYSGKIGKFTAKQWLAAHTESLQSLEPEKRQSITNKEMKCIVIAWLNMPKEMRTNAKLSGLNLRSFEAKSEMSFKAVIASYLNEYCKTDINSKTAILNTKRMCAFVSGFLEDNKIVYYSQLKRNIVQKYPEWRKDKRYGGKTKAASAGTINRELQRLAAIIKHGVKYHGWRELYLLDGIRVKHTQENTKNVRPFEIDEVKSILAWLWSNAEKTGNWYLHDMALLSVCTGLEAKALNLITEDWFKFDLGILRVYDKLISGVLDAKTQNRARDIPLSFTTRKIRDRSFIFKRQGRYANENTAIHGYSRFTFARCEAETGIKDVDWHRFRHTCATARLSAGWQLIRVSRMLGHSNINTTAQHYAE